MKSNFRSLSQNATALDAARQMQFHEIGFVPICDATGKVLGTVTDRDLALRIVANSRSAETPISEVMSREIIACRPGDDLRTAEALMARHHKSRIMCTDDGGHLKGVISLSDLAAVERAGRLRRVLREVSGREVQA